MNESAIETVTKALADRITAATGLEVFVGPLDDDDADVGKVVLFLYRVAANSHLRNAEHVVPREGDSPIRHRGALPLDLHYLVTVAPIPQSDGLPALKLLGQVMQALNEDPELVGLELDAEPARITLDSQSSEEMGRIWALFPAANYRTSVTYVVTPVWIDPTRPAADGPPVRREPHGFGHLRSNEAPL